jgi:type 1 glutamine amidotransferase
LHRFLKPNPIIFMKIYRSLFCVLTASLLTGAARAAEIKALIVTGQNNHNWQVSHVALKKTLENSGLFVVDLAVSPPKGGDMSGFAPNFKAYQVVVLDYNGDEWSPQTNTAVLEYAKGGGGIVVYHAANNAFPEWKEYNQITGLGGWNNRSEKSGPYAYWKDGKVVKDNAPGVGGSHGAQHEFALTARTKHPVTDGLPAQWQHVKDELYDRLRGPGDITPLFTAYSATENGGSGREEPLIFTVNYGKARVFHTTLGHAGASLTDNAAMQCTGFQVTLLRGAEWAATGKVTQRVPDDFPNENTRTLRKTYKFYPQPMGMQPQMSEFWQPQPAIITPGEPTPTAYLTAPSDAIVLFDGKDLSQWQNPHGEPAGWDVHDGIFTVNPQNGDIQTREEFSDFQLHIEWSAPNKVISRGQGRGNSGVFMLGAYEVQVLDSYDNETYANGMAGSIYKQSAPLVNPMRPVGQWNVFDIIFTAPTFRADGEYRTPPTITVFFNGVVVQNNLVIKGTTEYIGFPRTDKRSRGPILLQNHGNTVNYRNVWIRNL